MEIIDIFTGWVENIDNGIAQLMFKNQAGEEFYGSYDASRLESLGITYGTNFECKVEKNEDESISLNFKKADYQGPTSEERMELYKKLCEKLKLTDDDFDDFENETN